jgi:UDP-3-O-[3-hydroxymyristoyl] glucosamine N-acyltransferase
MKIIKSQIVKIKKGKNLKIVNPVNIYGAEFGNNCFVGPFTEIQKNVKIGDNTKIQSHSFICELVKIGKDCFIGHGVMFINDKFEDRKPAGGKKNKWKKTKLDSNVYIGSNSTILPVNICSNVVVGGGSVVTKNITRSGTYAGNPAKKIK